MKRMSFIFVVVALVLGTGSSFAEKPVTLLHASGVLERIEDGELVLKLDVKPEQLANLMKLPGLEAGIPSTPGRLGVLKNEVYVRYVLQPGVEGAAAGLIGQRVAVELGRDRRITGIVRAK